jgi:hypothetical protein
MRTLQRSHVARESVPLIQERSRVRSLVRPPSSALFCLCVYSLFTLPSALNHCVLDKQEQLNKPRDIHAVEVLSPGGPQLSTAASATTSLSCL